MLHGGGGSQSIYMPLTPFQHQEGMGGDTPSISASDSHQYKNEPT